MVLVEMSCPGVLGRSGRRGVHRLDAQPTPIRGDGPIVPAVEGGQSDLAPSADFVVITAMPCNPAVAALRQRLQAQNRLKPMQVLAAEMRKLLSTYASLLSRPTCGLIPTTPRQRTRQRRSPEPLPIRKEPITPYIDCEPIIPLSRSACRQAAAQGRSRKVAGPHADGAPCP